MTDETGRAYAVKRVKSLRPELEIETWDDLMAMPMTALGLDIFNELLEADLVEITQEARDLFKSPPAGKPKKDPSMRKDKKK